MKVFHDCEVMFDYVHLCFRLIAMAAKKKATAAAAAVADTGAAGDSAAAGKHTTVPNFTSLSTTCSSLSPLH